MTDQNDWGTQKKPGKQGSESKEAHDLELQVPCHVALSAIVLKSFWETTAH